MCSHFYVTMRATRWTPSPATQNAEPRIFYQTYEVYDTYFLQCCIQREFKLHHETSEITSYCQVREGIRNHIHNAPKDIDLLHWLHRTALELVGQGGLGYSFDSLSEDVPYTVYTRAMKDLMYGSCIPHSRSVWLIDLNYDHLELLYFISHLIECLHLTSRS